LSRGQVALNALEDLAAADREALRADAADVERFLDTSGPAAGQPDD
jgi:hypothetical protein